jgi:hypothetical protein
MEKSFRMMKRIIFFLVAALVAVSPALAQEMSSKDAMKRAKQESKKETKKLIKDGYDMIELGDLETALADFLYDATFNKKVQIYGTAIRSNRTNAIDEAIFNALANYSATEGGIMKGRADQQIASIGEDEINNYVSAYERMLVQELKGEVRPRITLMRQSKKQYDVIVYCLLDKDHAHKARMTALQNAAEEQKLIDKYGDLVSDFINKGFEE